MTPGLAAAASHIFFPWIGCVLRPPLPARAFPPRGFPLPPESRFVSETLPSGSGYILQKSSFPFGSCGRLSQEIPWRTLQTCPRQAAGHRPPPHSHRHTGGHGKPGQLLCPPLPEDGGPSRSLWAAGIPAPDSKIPPGSARHRRRPSGSLPG